MASRLSYGNMGFRPWESLGAANLRQECIKYESVTGFAPSRTPSRATTPTSQRELEAALAGHDVSS